MTNLVNWTKNYCYLQICRKYSSKSPKRFEDIPGPISLPILGTLYQYLPVIGQYQFDKLHLNGLKKYKKFGPIVRERIVPGVNIVWLFDPDDVETLFRHEGKYPQRRSHLALEKYRLDRPNVYNTGGLLPTNGTEWLRLRSVFQKGLSSPASVLTFLSTSNDAVDEWVDRIKNQLIGNEAIDYLPELSRLFLELTCIAALDLRLNSFSRNELKTYSRSSRLMRAALTTNSCILKTDNGPQLWRKFETPLYKKLKRAQRYMEEVAIDLLSLKMSIFIENKPEKSKTLLEQYLSSPELDFKDIIGMVCDFLLAGIDTTTYSTSFLLYHLANDQRVQDELYKECVRLLPHATTPITKNVLSEATYAKAAIKESLRLRPVSVGVGRILENDAVFSNYRVPKDTVVVTQNQVSSRLDEHFERAIDFVPERWIKTHPSFKHHHPFLVLPFGHGPRSCIARRLAEQNMLIVLLKLTRNFKMTWRGDDLDSKSLLINKPDGPIAIDFATR